MGWERRPGGTYFYAARWENGRVVRTYYGRGPVAELAAACDADVRERRRADTQAVASLREELAPADEAVAALDRACQLALDAELAAARLRGHRSGVRRSSDMDGPVEDDRGAAAEDEVRGLFERARGGDEAAAPALRRALDDNPSLSRLYGDVGLHARRTWIQVIAGKDVALRESLERKVAAMLDELVAPSAPPLERLLAEQVVASWLVLSHADAMAAQAGQAGVSLRQATFALKRQGAAHRRHTTAIAALATFQRLLSSDDVLVPAENPDDGPQLSAVGTDVDDESPANDSPPRPSRHGRRTPGLAAPTESGKSEVA